MTSQDQTPSPTSQEPQTVLASLPINVSPGELVEVRGIPFQVRAVTPSGCIAMMPLKASVSKEVAIEILKALKETHTTNLTRCDLCQKPAFWLEEREVDGVKKLFQVGSNFRSLAPGKYIHAVCPGK